MNALYRLNKLKQEGERIAIISIKNRNQLMKKYNGVDSGKRIPTKKDLKELACQLANGDKSIGRQYLKIAVDSTTLHKKCSEQEAIQNRWFNIIHELGHIYINCRQIDFYKNNESDIKAPSIIDNLPGLHAPFSVDEYDVRH